MCCCVVSPGMCGRSISELLESAAANAINQGTSSIDVLDGDAIERSILFDALGILLFVTAAGSCAVYFLQVTILPVQHSLSHERKFSSNTLSDSIEIISGRRVFRELVKSFNQMTDN